MKKGEEFIMNQITTKLMSLGLASVTFVSALLLPGVLDAQKAKADTGYTSSETYFFDENNCGFYTEPVASGTYKSVILIHGHGEDCTSWLAQQMPSAMASWTSSGLLKPMNIIMPWVSDSKEGQDRTERGVYGHRDFGLYYADDLAMNIENISGKADTQKYKTAIAGYSMGGCDALTAAATYPKLFQEVGSLSSSFTFHTWYDPSIAWSTFHSLKDMDFSEDLSTYITYGNYEKNYTANDALFGYSGDHYYQILHDEFGFENTVKHECMDQNWGPHGNPLFLREIFMYFYYLQNGEVPDEGYVEKACASVYKAKQKNLSKPSKHNPSKKDQGNEQEKKQDDNQNKTPLSVSETKSTKTEVLFGDPYTVSVTAQGGKSGSYKYDWQYSVYPDKDFSSTTRTDKDGKSLNGKSSLEIADATRDIYYRCKVSDGSSTVYSKPVQIHVAPKINSITSDGYGKTLEPNKTYKIHVDASGQELQYMWEYSVDGNKWDKSTNKGYNTATATYINRPENNLKAVYYRVTVTSVGSKSTATIKLGK